MYKDVKVEREGLKYLEKKLWEKGKYGVEIRALLRVKCGNMEEDNKYGWRKRRGNVLYVILEWIILSILLENVKGKGLV